MLGASDDEDDAVATVADQLARFAEFGLVERATPCGRRTDVSDRATRCASPGRTGSETAATERNALAPKASSTRAVVAHHALAKAQEQDR